MDKLKTINIKGKEYVEVSTRIAAFNDNFENGRIATAMQYEAQYVRCQCTIVPDTTKPEIYFTGHAEEDRTQGNINKTNATENCETSAVGRALAMMGIGIVDGVASADEVRHAIQKQEAPVQATYTQPSVIKPAIATTGSLGACKLCGADNKMSQAGKVYCSKVCWKNTPAPKHDTYQVVPPIEQEEVDRTPALTDFEEPPF